MSNSALKLLAQKAKKRLSTAGQNIQNSSNEKISTAYLVPTDYKLVASKQTIEEDPLYEKTKKLLLKADVFNPLAELTDHSIFDNLSTEQKEKYIIDISKKYNEIKNYFLENQIL